MQGTALADIAASVLSDSAGIEAASLQKLLNHLDPPGDGPILSASGVLIVDEASRD